MKTNILNTVASTLLACAFSLNAFAAQITVQTADHSSEDQYSYVRFTDGTEVHLDYATDTATITNQNGTSVMSISGAYLEHYGDQGTASTMMATHQFPILEPNVVIHSGLAGNFSTMNTVPGSPGYGQCSMEPCVRMFGGLINPLYWSIAEWAGNDATTSQGPCMNGEDCYVITNREQWDALQERREHCEDRDNEFVEASVSAATTGATCPVTGGALCLIQVGNYLWQQHQLYEATVACNAPIPGLD